MIYRFADLELDTGLRELRDDATVIATEPRTFDLLLYLLEHRDRVIGKDELLAAIWPSQYVSETALTRGVMKARRAVRDDSGSQNIIRTVHGHGYRLVADVSVVDKAEPGAAVEGPDFALPETHYARSGAVSIAYQVIGDGPVDIVLVNGWISNVEMAWEHPRPRQFLRGIASIGRLINFDKRGTGLSDRGGALPTFEERMDDVRAVMDAAGSERAILLGYSEGGPMCALFAATYPERSLGLVLYGTYMKRVRSIDYPWAPTREERLATIASAEENWDQGLDVAHYAPSLVGDTEFAAWLMAYWRRSASPRTAAELLRMNTDIDVCKVLPSIRVPTLVMHRTGDRDSRVDEGRYIAAHVPGARFIELPGEDHLVWAGDIDEILGPLQAFAAGIGERLVDDTALVTLVAVVADVRDASCDEFGQRCEGAVDLYRGVVAAAGGGEWLAGFDGSGRALRCALAISDRARADRIEARIAVHLGPCSRSGTAFHGTPVDAVRGIARGTPAGTVLASQAVKDVVTGFRFGDRRNRTAGGVTVVLYDVSG